ncbi:MAG: cell division protein ZapA [Rickettsiales bacterium]|jgi:cell division protein ZapA|nr:cell division protein ZapA [Rickettsiales bacterium]
MPTVSFKINGKDYSVDCGEGQEAQILSIVRHVDDKARELSRRFGNVDSETLLLMVCILVAGDLDKARARAAGLERSIDALRTGALDEDRLAEFVLGLGKKVKEISGTISNIMDLE